jgi:hypothetical protein
VPDRQGRRASRRLDLRLMRSGSIRAAQWQRALHPVRAGKVSFACDRVFHRHVNCSAAALGLCLLGRVHLNGRRFNPYADMRDCEVTPPGNFSVEGKPLPQRCRQGSIAPRAGMSSCIYCDGACGAAFRSACHASIPLDPWQ